MTRLPAGRRASTLVAGLLMLSATAPVAAFAGEPGQSPLRADLDGKPIPLIEVGDWYCHDFDAPVIHCFSSPKALETDVAPILAATSVTYVVVYEFTTFQGAYLYISNDVTVLGTLGWNDRISSFSVRNSMSGRFWTDWFYGGTSYYFCCNQWVGSLGSYDNTFSSVFHY
jgi:hypothetical protein